MVEIARFWLMPWLIICNSIGVLYDAIFASCDQLAGGGISVDDDAGVVLEGEGRDRGWWEFSLTTWAWAVSFSWAVTPRRPASAAYSPLSNPRRPDIYIYL